MSYLSRISREAAGLGSIYFNHVSRKSNLTIAPIIHIADNMWERRPIQFANNINKIRGSLIALSLLNMGLAIVAGNALEGLTHARLSQAGVNEGLNMTISTGVELTGLAASLYMVNLAEIVIADGVAFASDKITGRTDLY